MSALDDPALLSEARARRQQAEADAIAWADLSESVASMLTLETLTRLAAKARAYHEARQGTS